MLDKFLPPTDNLYKFIAIAGLVLLFFSFFPNYLGFKLIEQMIEYNKTQKQFINEIDLLNKGLEKRNQNLEKYTNNLQELVKKREESLVIINEINKNLEENKIKESKDKYKELLINEEQNKNTEKEISQAKQKIDEESERLDEKNLLIKNKNADLDATGELIDYYKDQIFELRIISNLIFLAGLVCIVWGFTAWYRKIQKFEDKILENQVAEK